MTRAMVRILLTRTLVFAIFATMVLFSMNLVTNQRQEAQRQDEMRRTLGVVLMADRYEVMNIASYKEILPTIQNAYEAYDAKDRLIGYVMDVKQTVLSGDILVRMSFSPDGKTLHAMQIISEQDSVTAPDDFLGQFEEVRVPVALLFDVSDNEVANNEYPPLEGLQDGTYIAELDEADTAGYKDFVQMIIQGGKITQVTWDATQIDGGSNRAEASVSGAFVLQDNTVIWAAQAYAMENKLIEVQDPAKIAIKSDGTTEIVQDVSINVNAFLRLAEQCVENSMNGRTADITNPTTVPTSTPSAAPTGKATATPTGSGVTVTPTPQTTPEITATPVETEVVSPTIDTEATGDNIGNEDGVVLDDQSNTQSNSIDGLPVSEIKTLINEMSGYPEYSRAVVSSVNQAYLFLKYFLEKRAQ